MPTTREPLTTTDKVIRYVTRSTGLRTVKFYEDADRADFTLELPNGKVLMNFSARYNGTEWIIGQSDSISIFDIVSREPSCPAVNA